MAKTTKDELQYMTGFGSTFETEALNGALPVGQNSPQVCAYGLYAEQLSGTAFTMPRGKNQRSWLYRIRPSVMHSPFQEHANQPIHKEWTEMKIDPNQMRWNAMSLANGSDNVQIDFIDGLRLVCGAGDPAAKSGLGVYNYLFTAPMIRKAFHNSDGDLLIVPQEGSLLIVTELGKLHVDPCMIAVVPRGIKFSVHPVAGSDGTTSTFCRGYCCEIYQGHLELPGLGPIGANGLANARDFETPVACYEDAEHPAPPAAAAAASTSGNIASVTGSYAIVNKFQGKLFTAQQQHSPYDVVAWHGNYYPYRYDLRRFNCINSVTYDHPDPSIYTVLTVPSGEPGVAVLDFVIFPPRWMVAENTFRPPWYHRNCMSEYMGLIYGKYDAKSGTGGSAKKGGFYPGGSSLHSCMTPHGPDAATFQTASAASQPPKYFDQGLAFMFESTYLFKIAPTALTSESDSVAAAAAGRANGKGQDKTGLVGPTVQSDYYQCWQTLPKLFSGEVRPRYPWDK